MLTIYDGRGELWQWDIERKLAVTDETATEVHFSRSDSETALVCEVYSEGKARVVNIPNIMLQDYANLIAYTYDTTHTKRCTVFAINRRAKPADYVYTETEVKSYEALDARVRKLEKGGTGVGESAYEIAVRLGFEGSEPEWLESLKGEDGRDYVLTDEDKAEIAEQAAALVDIPECDIPTDSNDILLLDRATGKQYVLYVENGKLSMEQDELNYEPGDDPAAGPAVSFTVDADGNAVTGATLTVDEYGNGTITGAALTVDEAGNAVIA